MVNTDLPIIVSNYRELLFDEVPILFTGTNRFGTFIIGSSVDEDYSIGIERYFHIIVEKVDYFRFLKREVTYHALLQDAKPIFILDRLVSDGAYVVSQISFDEIPAEYRPSQDTLCPITAYEPSYLYSTSLIGGLADTNNAFPEEVSETQNSIAGAIYSALNSLHRWLGIDQEVLLKPATAGSFKINYEVRLKNIPLLFQSEAEYLQYLNEFLEYCFDHLPADSNQLASLNSVDLPSFNNLINRIQLLGAGAFTNVTESALRESVIEDLTTTSKALQSVAKTVGKNYKSIAITNLSANNEYPLGIINEEYQQQINEAVSVLTESKLLLHTEDEEAKEQTVHLYEFNKNTGSGLGYVRDPEDSSKQIIARITITDYEPVSPSPYTMSLDQNQFIKVHGILKKTGNRYKLEVIEKTIE